MRSIPLPCKSKIKISSPCGGKLAEFLARLWLHCHGYRILAANYRTGRGTHAGEIDIVALRRNTIIFVEVKKRSGLDKAAYAIRPAQQQRIIRGAEAFLQKHPAYQNCDVRFDAVLVSFPLWIRHIKNAWTS